MGMQCGYCGFELNRSVSVTREGGGETVPVIRWGYSIVRFFFYKYLWQSVVAVALVSSPAQYHQITRLLLHFPSIPLYT